MDQDGPRPTLPPMPIKGTPFDPDVQRRIAEGMAENWRHAAEGMNQAFREFARWCEARRQP